MHTTKPTVWERSTCRITFYIALISVSNTYISQARKVVALAAAYDVPIVPHASGVYSYHLQFAFTNCPMSEYIIMSPQVSPECVLNMIVHLVRCRLM